MRTKRSLKKRVLNDRQEEAYKFMKKAAASILEKDKLTTFGNFVADYIKIKTNESTNNWLLDMQMKELKANMSEEWRMLPSEERIK